MGNAGLKLMEVRIITIYDLQVLRKKLNIFGDVCIKQRYFIQIKRNKLHKHIYWHISFANRLYLLHYTSLYKLMYDMNPPPFHQTV